MKKVNRRWAWWAEDEDDATPPTQPIMLDEPQPPRWSGLYNHRGEKLYIAPEPFGFRRTR